ncbi:uncharacterized protein LOC135823733 [Sycon ciliatum]|uniref:uncharacterized protein LOC135823733 n=1 Tax=Sycon ciliatum TaxID=27933 RepID=UPI0031F6F456
METSELSSAGARLCLRRVGRPSTIDTIGDVFPIHLGTTTLGRAKTSNTNHRSVGTDTRQKRHIHLDSTVHKCLISRQHAKLQCSLGCDSAVNANISDLSVNGVFVNNVKIGRPTDLRPGDVVTLGHLRGAALPPGTTAAQPTSEFQFRLERCGGEQVATTAQSTEAGLAAISAPSSPCRAASPQSPASCTSFSVGPERNCRYPGVRIDFSTPPSPTGCSDAFELSASQQSVQSSGSFCFSTGLVPDSGTSASRPRPKHRRTGSAASSDAWSDADSTLLANGQFCSSVSSSSGSSAMSPGSSATHNSHSVLAVSDRCNISANDRCAALRTLSVAPPAEGDGKRTATALKGKTRSHAKAQKPLLSTRKSRRASAGVREATAKLTGRASRKQRPGNSGGDLEYHEDRDCCASVDCQRPGREKVLDWVQCDACELWYHVPCVTSTAQASLDLIRSAEFRCGCV